MAMLWLFCSSRNDDKGIWNTRKSAAFSRVIPCAGPDGKGHFSFWQEKVGGGVWVGVGETYFLTFCAPFPFTQAVSNDVSDI